MAGKEGGESPVRVLCAGSVRKLFSRDVQCSGMRKK